MPTSLTDLLAGVTVDGAKQIAVNLLAGAGFPVSAWQAATVGRAFTEAESQTYSDLASLVVSIAASGFLPYATGPWLDQLSQNLYQTTRKPAVLAQGTVVLTDGGGGPTAINPGQLWVSDATGTYLYQSINPVPLTLPLNGTLKVPVQAAAPGFAYSLGIGTITALVTSLPGVTVANPDNGLGLGSWLTQQGADAESDASLVLRCRARWPALGTGGGTALAYQGWALGASPEITRVVVVPGATVSVYLAGAAGPVSGSAVTLATAAIAPVMPIGIGLSVQSAAPATQVIAGTYTVKAASAANAAAKITTNVNALFASIPIGGKLYLSQLIEAFMIADPGMVDVTFTSPLNSVVLSASQVFTPPTGLGSMTVVKV